MKDRLVGYLVKIYLALFGYPDIGTHIYFSLVLGFLKPSSGERILDAGCGNGIYINSLVQKFGINGWGIDVNETYLKRAGVLAKTFRCTSQLKKMSLTNLLFPDGFFDKIICLQALQFIDDDKRAIKEIGRVLKKRGILVLSFPGEKYYDKIKISSGKLETMIVKRKGYSPEEMQALLKKRGFKILQKKIVSGPFFKKLVSIQSYFHHKGLALVNLIIFPLLGLLARTDLSLAKAPKDKAIYLFKAQKI